MRKALTLGFGTLIAAIACHAFDHFRGVYEPSEVTGRGAHVCTLLFLLLSVAAWSWSTRQRPIGHSLRGVAIIALVVAVGLTLVELGYFMWMRDDLATAMAVFTRSTLESRGAEPAYVEAFVRAVQESWEVRSILPNTFLLIAVWGVLLGAANTLVIRGAARLRALAGS